MIRVVLDTNVLVSAAIKEAGAEAAALDLITEGQFALCVSEPILAEYDRVLARPKLRLSPDRVRHLIAMVRTESILVQPGFALSISTDEADNRFLECAEAARADFLVTGNRRHFPRSWKTTSVVSAPQFLEIHGGEQSS